MTDREAERRLLGDLAYGPSTMAALLEGHTAKMQIRHAAARLERAGAIWWERRTRLWHISSFLLAERP